MADRNQILRAGLAVGVASLLMLLLLSGAPSDAQTYENPFDVPAAPRAKSEDASKGGATKGDTPTPAAESAFPELRVPDAPADSARSAPAAEDDPFRDDPVQPSDTAATRSRGEAMQPERNETQPDSLADNASSDAIDDLLSSGKFADAIPLLESETKRIPQEAEYTEEAFNAWFRLGLAYRMTARYDDAIKALTVAARLPVPADAESAAFMRRGIVWYYKGEPRIAILDFEHAASASNTDPRPEFWKGLVLAKQGKYREAITAYSSSIRLYQGLTRSGTYTQARTNRGLAYLAIGEIDFALADFDEVIRQEPESGSAYYKRAIALGRRGDLQEAVTSYTDSIRLDDRFAPAYYNRGLLHRRLGNASQANADLAKARELDPQIGARAQSQRLASR